MSFPFRSLLIILFAVFSSVNDIATAQTASDSTTTIRLRNTQESTQPPSFEEMAALNQMALAIDQGSVNDLSVALDTLSCDDRCGVILDTNRMLHRAARDSTPDIVGMLLDAGASPNLRNAPLDWTPLLTALAAARPANARLLVERGADPSLTGLDGTSAPFMAELLGLGDVIPYPPLQLSREEANGILLLAIEANDLAAVRLALEAGADPGATSAENGWSALMIASFHGFFDLAQMLMEDEWGSGADLVAYQEPEGGLSALHATLLGTRRTDPQPNVCTMAVLLSNGGDLGALTLAGLSVSDVAENMNLADMLTSATPSRTIVSNCVAQFGRDEPVDLVDAVLPAPSGPSGAAGQTQSPETPVLIPQEDLIKSLQRGLDTHNCRPGPIDGSFGDRSARAIELFNLVSPASCPTLSTLDPIGRSEASQGWTSAAQANVDALAACSPNPACGIPPGPDFYRDFSKGCWYRAVGVHPSEYATWDGTCDANGLITGEGKLTYHYPVAVPGNSIASTSGYFLRGMYDNGVTTHVLLDGTVQYVVYASGRALSVTEIKP
jgi:hypothetical protein